MAERCALVMAIILASSTMGGTPSHAQAVADRRVVALQWDGMGGPTPGVLDIAADGAGTLRFQMMKPERLCIGTISVIEGQRTGSWALACGDGMAASGRYLRQDRSTLGEGKGTDTGGRAVSFVVGQSLLPPPADAARAAPLVGEPKKVEAKKDEPAKRPAPQASSPPREQAPSTTDALNEAELRKARERNRESAVQAAVAAQLTSAELDAVRERFKPCWNPNFGGRNVADLVVEVEIYANPDGTIAQARPRQNVRLASDPFYQSAVDAAMRAVLRPQCGGIGGRPLPLPREKYEQWKSFVLTFDPKAMLGASAPVGTPTSPTATGPGTGDQPCSIAGPGPDFGLSVIAANLGCRLLAGLGEQAASAQQYKTDRTKRADILRTCLERFKEQPEVAGESDGQLRQRCEAIGASFPLMVYLGGFPTATERTQAVDACMTEGGGSVPEDQRGTLWARCAEEVSARVTVARDPNRNKVEFYSNAPPAADPAMPAPRPREPRRPKPTP